MGEAVIIRPQPGPQELFLSTPADIGIYGGAAGGGKSWAVLYEPLRHVTSVPDFAALFLRRNTTQIRNPGGLWDESVKMYPLTSATPVNHLLEWKWEAGGKVKMAHLEHEMTVLDWQGSQIPLIIFDELTHFSKTQFFYMLSRNRSMCGVRPYIRATCNPDADSWVAEFISWWIDQKTGYPIPERAGKLRWMIRQNDTLIWADTAEELVGKYGPDAMPKSVTFIPAKLTDNKKLMEADPTYMANLKALSYVERERLLGGNWKVRPSAGLYFRRSDVCIVKSLPDNLETVVRKWDLAATEPSDSNPDPDWTAGVKMGKTASGRYIVMDVVRDRVRSHKVREMVRKAATRDGHNVRIGITQDPGQAGKEQASSYVSGLAGYTAVITKESGDKVQRAEPFAAQWQAGNVDILEGPWNEDYLAEMEAFPEPRTHDDQVDGSSGAFSLLNTRVSAKPSTGGERVYD